MNEKPYWWVTAPKAPHYNHDLPDACAQLPDDWREPQRFDGRELIRIAALTVFLLGAFALIVLTIGALGVAPS